jgi:hypothetical protein
MVSQTVTLPNFSPNCNNSSALFINKMQTSSCSIDSDMSIKLAANVEY